MYDLKLKMVNVIGFVQRMHQMFVPFVFVILVTGSFRVPVTIASSQNQVIENLRLLSQKDDNGLQPSRLRALLVNDLRNILVKNVRINICSVRESVCVL